MGQAQFMRHMGCKLLGLENGVFILQSEVKNGYEWRISYANSEYSRFNAGLIELQRLKKEQNNG